jgi:hypothetical protein
MPNEDDMRDIDDTIQRMRLLEVDHGPDSWPAVQMRDIVALLNDSEGWQRQASDRTDDALQFVAERDEAKAENAKLRAALEEIRHSTYLRHATAVAAKALGHEA